jgi:hypothetical protein
MTTTTTTITTNDSDFDVPTVTELASSNHIEEQVSEQLLKEIKAEQIQVKVKKLDQELN